MGGADDYLTKHFEPGEVLAHVCAVLRRSEWASSEAQGAEPEEEYIQTVWGIGFKLKNR